MNVETGPEVVRSRPGRMVGIAPLVAALVACVLVGCAEDRERGTGQSGEKIELSVLWWGGTQRAQLTNQVLDLYTSRHPNVTFKRETREWNGYYGRLESTLAGGASLDLVQLNEDVITEYSTRNIVLELSALTAAKGRIEVDRISRGLLDSARVDGKLRAIPVAGNTQSVVYDLSLIKQFGMAEPQIGWNYEQFISWAADLSGKGGGQVFGSMDPSGAQRALWAWLRTQGKEFYSGSRLGFESGDLRRWFEMWSDARSRGALAPADLVHSANSESIAKQLVVTRQAAASFIWSNQMPEAQKLTDHELGITSYPGDPKGQWARASMYWAISKESPHPEETADVIDFMVNDPEVGRILGTERGLPANLDIREQIAATLTPAMRLTLEFEKAILPRFGPTPPPPPRGQSALGALLITAAENVMYGRTTAERAAEEFTAQAAQALSG